MESNEKVYGDLVSNHIAAIHYAELKQGVNKKELQNYLKLENYDLTDDKKIKDAKLAIETINRLRDYADVGAVVVADYTCSDYTGNATKNPKTIGIGILDKGTTVEIKRFAYPDDFTYKQVKLLHPIDLGQADFALILAIHPRGSTVRRWEEGEKIVRFIYKRELGLLSTTSDIDFRVLFPAQQEVLCSEYIRTKGPEEFRLKYLLLPVGRGMKSIDLFGSSDKRFILGQVSFSEDPAVINEKIHSLKDAVLQIKSKKTVAKMYFGPEAAKNYVSQFAPDLTFVSLEDVFEEMKGTGILDDMMGIKM
jgi:hypothetical protein